MPDEFEQREIEREEDKAWEKRKEKAKNTLKKLEEGMKESDQIAWDTYKKMVAHG